MISPLPIYTPTFEGWDDPKRSTFPLQLFGFHYKSRTHSSYGNIDVLQAACRQEVWINPLDAQNAVSRMAIRFASLTIVERCVYPPKSRRVFCRASARWVRAHGIMRIWLAIKLTTAPASIRSRRCVLPPGKRESSTYKSGGNRKNLSRLLRDVFTRPELPVLRTQRHLKLFWMSIVSCYENHQP